MAFENEGMRISSAGFGELNCKIWCYTSVDSRATILTNGYFSVELLINTGDLIYIKNGDTPPFLAYVSAISPAVTTVTLPDAAIPADTITTAMLQDLCITNEKVSHDISGTKLAPLSIPAGTLEAASVATGDIELLAITDALIDSVSGAKIAAASIPTGAYGAGSIIGTDIAPNTITATELGSLTGWVTSARIANGAVATIDIADEAVTYVKLGTDFSVVKFKEQTTTSAAATSQAFTVTGMTTAFSVWASFETNTNSVNILTVAASADTVTITFSAAPAATDVLTIFGT